MNMIKTELTVLDEFKKLIPSLTEEEFKGLEQNILLHGVRTPLDVWGNILIDGHNRYEICQLHGIPFETKQVEFSDNNEAKVWIIRNQFDRRNLNAYNRAKLALELEHIFKEKARENLKVAASTTNEKLGNKVTPFLKSENPSDEIKPVNSVKEVATLAKIGHDTVAKVKYIEKNAPEEMKEKLDKGEVSINQVFQQVKKEEIKQKRKEDLFAAQNELQPTEKKYRVIYADPPWKYNEEQHTDFAGTHLKPLGSHYPSMSIKELCELPVDELTEDNAVLFLWVTSPLLEESFDIIKAWGFKYKTSMVWDKVKHNVGNYVSVRHELLLICTKGSCTPDVRKLHDSVVESERTEHSVKPEVFRSIIEEIYSYGNRIELFARKKTENWDVWGNQA